MGYDLHSGLRHYTADPTVGPTGIDTAAVVTRVRRRRTVRAATTGLVSTAAAAVLTVTAFGLAHLPTTDQVAPAAPSPSTIERTPTPEPTRTADPTSPSSRTPVPATTPVAPTPAVPPADEIPVGRPVFRTGARVADFPSRAPEADVVAYLTQSLGVDPELRDPDFACAPGAVPGHVWGWPGTGVGLRIRTTDDSGASLDPYVAAWTLMDPSQALNLATDAGLRAGDTRDRVLAAYPDATYGEQDFSGALEWWYSAGDDGGTLLAIGADDGPVYRIESGYGCGE